MAFEINDFQKDVIEVSRHTPVLVDFWAPWCGPCRVLGPVLEKLAAGSEDKWKLAKVNTDANPDLSVQYGIRGIPAVKLFVNGEVVDEFTGALPEYAVKQWLEKALPNENKRRIEQAEVLLNEGDAAQAEQVLREVLADEPENPKARIMLAQIVVFRDPQEAESLATSAAFAGPGFLQVEEAVKTVVRLMWLREAPEALPDEPGRETYVRAIDALAARNFDAAVRLFISVLQENRYYDADGARKACIAIFVLLGDQHPVTLKHRRMFDMVLY